MTAMMAFTALLATMLAVSGLLIAHSMRKYSSRRADSERRAAEAFAEMQRLTKELRERNESGRETTDRHLTPGERLQRQYPGVRPTPTCHQTPVGEKA